MMNSMPLLGATKPGGVAGGIATAMRHTLSNGIVVLMLPNPISPTVSLRGEIRVGSVNELAEKSGLASFTAASLIRGTETRSFQDIVIETETRGCSVHAGGGMHVTGFSGKTLKETLPLVIDILSGIITKPTFPEQEIERLRGIILMNLREYEQETHVQAHRAAREMLFPKEHAYHRLSSGTMETVQSISREDMVAFHQLYVPSTTVLSLVGDFEPDAVIAELEQTFGHWKSNTEAPDQTLPPVGPIDGIQKRTIAMEGKVQSDVLFCVHGMTRNDPDYYKMKVANLILGRIGMGGRLGDNVREEQGLAYHVSSTFQAGTGAGPWMAMAGVSPANVDRAIEAILHEIEQFKEHGPTEEELSDAHAYLTGSLVLGLETNDGIASTMLDIEYYDLGFDFIERYPEMITSVTHEDVVEVARKYLSTENYVLTVAGP